MVGVHAAESRDGLVVVSVIAAPEVGPAAVHAAATEAAALVVARREGTASVSLFDLPLGPGHAWDLTERVEEVPRASSDRVETLDALLAPWSASSLHDLTDAPGVAAAGLVIEGWLAPPFRPAVVSARQAATARYTREGFEAAAVTVVAVPTGAAVGPGVVVHRHATLRFDRPHAVAAVTRATAPGRGGAARRRGRPGLAGPARLRGVGGPPGVSGPPSTR